MSLTTINPDLLAAAAADIAGVGSSVQAGNALAAPRITGVLAAAADEVSAAVAAILSGYGRDYQELAGQAGEFHRRSSRH